METAGGSHIAALLLVMTGAILYFVYMVHLMSRRQQRLERYLVTSARILSICVGGMALPPIFQQVGKLFSHAQSYDEAADLEWWAQLHHLSQQQAPRQPHRHAAGSAGDRVFSQH